MNASHAHETTIVSSHSLFTAFGDGSVEKFSHLGVNAAASHVPVLRHGNLGLPEVVSPNSCGRALVVDQGGDVLRRPWVVTSGTPNASNHLRGRLLRLVVKRIY